MSEMDYGGEVAAPDAPPDAGLGEEGFSPAELEAIEQWNAPDEEMLLDDWDQVERAQAAEIDDRAIETRDRLLAEWEGELGPIDPQRFDEEVRAIALAAHERGIPINNETVLEMARAAAETVAAIDHGNLQIAAQLEIEHGLYGEFDDTEAYRLAEAFLPRAMVYAKEPPAAARLALTAAVQALTGGRKVRSLSDVTRYHQRMNTLGSAPSTADRKAFSDSPLGAITAKHADAVRRDAQARGGR